MIVKALWPKAGLIDEILIKSSEYLMEVAHSLRVHLKTHLQGVKTKTNPNPAPVPKPNVATIWVAKSFPLWQSIILTSLKKHYEVCNVNRFFSVMGTDLIRFFFLFNFEHLLLTRFLKYVTALNLLTSQLVFSLLFYYYISTLLI